MANGIEGQKDLYGTFLRWAQEGKIPEKELPHKASGEIDGPKVVAYVLAHSEKFSSKIQKEIEVLKKAFALLGFFAPDIDLVLADSPTSGAKRLVDKGKELEGKAKAAPAESKEAERNWSFAEKSYRLALQMDRDNAGAHRALADLMYRRHQTEAARQHAAFAVRVADPKDLVEMVQWLQTVGDAKVDRELAVNFVAKELIGAKRYADAKTLYEMASRKADELDDKALAQKFHEKALVAEEMGTPYKLAFDRKSNPEAMKLFEALRKAGIPTGLMEGGSSNGDHLLDAVELMRFSSGDDPRVVKVRQELGLEPPPWAGKKGAAKLAFASEREKTDFEAMSWNEKLSCYHSRLADQAKGDADKLKHLETAAHYAPGSADAHRKLAEFLVEARKTEEAIAAYEAVVAIAPQSADDRKILGDLYLSLERWQEASRYLPVSESAPILIDRVEGAASWLVTQDMADEKKLWEQEAKALERRGRNQGTAAKAEAGGVSADDLIQAKKTAEQVAKSLEGLEKNFSNLSKDDQAAVLRVRARLDVVLGRIKAVEGELDAAKAKYQSAVAAADKVLATLSNDVPALLQRAEAYERLGAYEKAMADYQAVLQVSPGSLGEIYTDFRGRYQAKLRTDFRTEMENFKRLSYDKTFEGQRDAYFSMYRLAQHAETLRKLPALSKVEQFDNMRLAREFYQFRVQFWESKSLMPFEGFKPAGNLFDIAKNSLDQIAETEKFTAFLENIQYLENLIAYKKDLATIEGEMRDLRDSVLSSLQLKPGESASLEQVENAGMVVSVDKELGYYSGLANALDQYKTLIDALPSTVLDSSYRVEVYGQILMGWKAVRAQDEDKYSLGLPSDSEITMKLSDIYYGVDFKGPCLKDAAEAYAKSQGLPWDEKAFHEMYRQAFIAGETEEARYGQFFSAEGLKTFLLANQQAQSSLNQANQAGINEDYASSRGLYIQALQIYAQLGNEPKVKELIEYIEDQQSYVNQEGDTLRAIDTLDMQTQMYEALRGSGMTADIHEGRATFEDVMLEKARSTARSLIGNDYSYSNVTIQGMMAARNFFEQVKDQESVNEIDKNLKEHQSSMRDHISFLVDTNERGTEHDMKAYGAEWSMYTPDQRKGQIMEAGSLVQTDLALLATKDISKAEVRKELGKQLMEHTDLWRRMIETNPDLPADFRLEQAKQLAATYAMFKKSFTEGDTPILQADALKAPTEAIGKLTSKILNDNDYMFFPTLGGNQDWAVQEMRQHGLGERLENGILGYYIDRGSDSDLKALNKDDWAEIEKIKTMYSSDWSLAETSIKIYLNKVGKFRELTDEEIALKDSIAADFQERLNRAQTDGDAQFLSAINPGFIRGFAQADVQAHEILAASRNAELPYEDRLEKSMEAAQAFGQMGIESRMEEALKPLKEHIEGIKDNPALKASGYYSLAQLYEVSGMDKKAKDYLAKVGAMDPGAQATSQHDKALHEMAVFSLAKIQLADNNVTEAKKLLITIRENALAKDYLQKLDEYEYQKRVGYPLEFLSGVLTAEIDSKRGNPDDINYLLSKKDKIDEEQKDVQAFLNEIGRLCASGECSSVQEAMDKLRAEPRYHMLYYFLDNKGRGKDTLAFIKTMANPALTDQQMSGEALRLAEKLLGSNDFDFSMNVAAPLMKDPYVGPQATKLVKDRIPDEAKWYYRKKAIWGAIKDILIVPAIIEGRYKDAAISAIITICSFGVGRVVSAGAKIAWAGFTARSLARAGWMARFAAAAPRAFRVTEVVVVAAADNAGFTVGGMLGESAVTGKNAFGWDRFKHEMLLGMAPFGLVHFSGKTMGAITKRAEHIPWMKVATEAEAALLKQQGKASVTRGWRAALWGGHRMMNATAFTLGGVFNQQIGFAEKDGTPLALMFLQNIAMDLQMTAAHGGLNKLTGGKLAALDRKLDRELYLAPTLAKLKINPKHPAGKAMSEFIGRYGDSLAAKRGKPLSSKELLNEVSKLNAPVETWLKKQGLQGNSFEAARLHMFRVISDKGWSVDTVAEYTRALPDSLLLDHAVNAIFKGEKAHEDREAVKGLVAAWALADAGTPKEFGDRLKAFAEMSPDMGDTLRASVNEILGAKASQTAAGRRLMQQLFLRVMVAADRPEEIPPLIRSIGDMAPKLRSRMDKLLAASGLAGPEASLAMTEWVLAKGHGPQSLEKLLEQAKQGKIVFTLVEGKISLAEVAPANQATRKADAEQSLAAWEKTRSFNEIAELSAEFGLERSLFSKADRERYHTMLADAAKQGKLPLELVRDLFEKIRPHVEKHVDPMHREGVLRGLYVDILAGKIGNKELLRISDGLSKGENTLEVSGLGEYAVVKKEARGALPDIDVSAKTKVQVRSGQKPGDGATATDQNNDAVARSAASTDTPSRVVKPSTKEVNVVPLRKPGQEPQMGPQGGTRVLGKRRKGQTPAPADRTPVDDLPMAAKGQGGEGVPGRVTGSGSGRGEEPTRVGSGKAPDTGPTDRDAPKAGFFLTSDGLDSFSVAQGQEASVFWSSAEAGIPGKAWKVEIKPVGQGEFVLIPHEGDVAIQAGTAWGPASRSGTMLQDGMRLRIGDVEITYRTPGADAARDLATGSRQAEENIAGNLLEYYAGSHEKATLDIFAKRQDAWGEQARLFQEGMKELESKLAEYRKFEADYRKAPTVDKRKTLNEKWAEVESTSSALHTSRYHLMERNHTWSIKARQIELQPLEVFFALQEVQSYDKASGRSSLVFHLDYKSPEELPGKEGNFAQVATKDFVTGKVEVSDWKTAQGLMEAMKAHEGLRITEPLKIGADRKAAKAVVTIDGRTPITLEFTLTAKVELRQDREARIRSDIRMDYETLAMLNGDIQEMKRNLEASKAETDPKKIEAMKKNGEYVEPAKVTEQETKIAEYEKIFAEAKQAFNAKLVAEQRNASGAPYAELMPQIVKSATDPIFSGEVTSKNRGQVRDKILKYLEGQGIRVSTDNAKAIDSMIDLAFTAKAHGLIDQPGGITRAQFFALLGELYLHNNPAVRIGSAELTHVPMVVEGTLNHFEGLATAQGKMVTVAEKKAAFLAALLHDAGKWDPNIRTHTGYTILKTSPFNKTGQDVVVKSGQSLKEALAEQKLDPDQIKLPFDGMTAILVHHDATTVREQTKQLVKLGILDPLEAQRIWEAIQYHGFVSSWIVSNSMAGLGIKSHVFKESYDKQFKPYLDAFQAVSKRMGESGIPDLPALMKDPAFAADVAKMRNAFEKLPPYVKALMLGDHQGQIDIAKYMGILSVAAKDASAHDLFFGNSMTNSVLGVLRTHSYEQILISPDQGQASARAFKAAEDWLAQTDRSQPGLAKAILTDKDLAARYEQWKAGEGKNGSVQEWLKTIKVKDGGKNSGDFLKIQGLVEKSFYEFYTLDPAKPLEWRLTAPGLQAGDDPRVLRASDPKDLGLVDIELKAPVGKTMFTIGRNGAAVDLLLNDGSVSKIHATFFQTENGQWWVMDGTTDAAGKQLPSRNGIIMVAAEGHEAPVNREGWTSIQPGQRLKIGNHYFVFQPHEVPSAQAAFPKTPAEAILSNQKILQGDAEAILQAGVHYVEEVVTFHANARVGHFFAINAYVDPHTGAIVAVGNMENLPANKVRGTVNVTFKVNVKMPTLDQIRRKENIPQVIDEVIMNHGQIADPQVRAGLQKMIGVEYRAPDMRRVALQAEVPEPVVTNHGSTEPPVTDWTSVKSSLEKNAIPLPHLAPNVEEVNLYIGDPVKIGAGEGLGVVVNDGANRGNVVLWGQLRREGDHWLYYPAEHPEAQPVRDSLFGTKIPRPDGAIEVGEGDRLSIGFADFQIRNGEFVHTDDIGALTVRMALHNPGEIPKVARAGDVTATVVEPVFTHLGIQADATLLAGNVDFRQQIPITVLPAEVDRGSIAMSTTQGKGYSKPNEDTVMTVRGPHGETIILDVDGIGGHGNGDAASLLVSEAFSAEIPRSGDTQTAWQLANAAVRRFNGALKEGHNRDQALDAARKLIADPASHIDKRMATDADAVAVSLRIDPPKNPGDPHVAHFEWVGDARGVILRKDGQGRWQLGYRTVDEGMPSKPGALMPERDFEVGGANRTLAMALHPHANVVTNSIAGDAAVSPRSTQHGELPDPTNAKGAREAGDVFSRGIALHEGDLVILGSDGLWENFTRTKALLELIKDAKSSEDVTRIMTDEAHWRMDILSLARRGQLPEEIPGLFRIERNGGIIYQDLQGNVRRAGTLYIDALGNVYDSPNAERPIDHYKTDNFSMATYMHHTATEGPRETPRVLNAPDPKDIGLPGKDARIPQVPAMDPKAAADAKGFDAKLGERRQRLSEKAKGLGEVQGTAKKYSPDEIEELLHQTLERGQPLELVTTGKGLRDVVDEYMVAYVNEFMNAYPKEIEAAKNRNPYTGESFVSRNQQGKEVQRYDALYRFARMRMNEKLGQPIFGEPSFRQKVLVENFVARALKKDGSSYEKAKQSLRDEAMNLSEDFQKAFLAAPPHLRVYLVSALVEDAWSISVSNPDAAMRLVQFIGKAGLDREMGVAVDFSGEPLKYSLVVGNWDQISHPDNKNVYLPIHSHTKFYLNQRGKVMGVQDTMVTAVGKEIKRSATVLPSDADLGYMGEFAKDLARRGKDVPPIFDAASKTLKGWVQHPYGIAEIRMQVDGMGNVTHVQVDYGFYDPKHVDTTHGERAKALQVWLGKKYPKAKAEFKNVEIGGLEQGMPGRIQ